MHGSLSDEQALLQQTVRDIAAEIGLSSDGEATRVDATAAWTMLAGAGLTGLLVPEAAGGTPSSTLDVAVVVEALASTLPTVPFLGSAVLASTLLTAAEAHEQMLPELVSGARTAAVVLDPELRGIQRRTPGIEGVAWDCAASPLLLALDADGEHLLGSDDGAAGDELEAFDLLRAFRRVSADGAWRPLGKIDRDAHLRWLVTGLVHLSAEMCGVMAGALDLAVAYARQRKQFDQPIGSFQAVQHLCAEAHVRLEASRSAVYAAADLVDAEGPANALAAARAAKIQAGDSARFVTETSLQVHGGIGMTWEFPGHHFLRRAWMDNQTLGDSEHHLAAVATHLLGADASE